MSSSSLARQTASVKIGSLRTPEKTRFAPGESVPCVPPHVHASSPLLPQYQRVLAHLYETLPYTLDAANRKEHAFRKKMHRTWAITMDEIRMDPPGWISALRIDVDTAEGLNSWRAVPGLPPPSYAVVNPQNGHAHLSWSLEKWIPITDECKMRYLDDVRRDLIRAISGADAAYCGRDMTHSPWSPNYRVTVYTEDFYDLGQLRASIPRAKAPRRFYGGREPNGRNDYVFLTGLRFGRQQLAKDRVIGDGLERDIMDEMRACLPDAEARFPASHSYTSQEMTDSHRSILGYLGRDIASGRILIHPTLRKQKAREKKRRQRGSDRDRASYTTLSQERRELALKRRSEGVRVVDIVAELKMARSEYYRLLKSVQNKSVSSCPSIQEYDGTTDVLAEKTISEIGKKSAEIVLWENLDEMLAGESVATYAWLTNPKLSGCGLSGKQQRIRATLLDIGAARVEQRPKTIEIRFREAPQLTEARIGEGGGGNPRFYR